MKVLAMLMVIQCLAASLQAAPFKSLEHQRMLMLLQTKYTHMDTDGDGETDVIRSYDHSGSRLLTLTSLSRVSDHQTLEEFTDFRKLPYEISTVFHLIDKQRQESNEVESIVEKFYDTGKIWYREHIYLDDENGKKMRELFEYLDQGTTVTVYSEEKSGWIKHATRELPRFHLQPTTLSTVGQAYVDCLNNKDPVRLGHCEELAGTDPIANFTSIADHYATLTCTYQDQLFTPSGFRMDLNSCQGTEVRSRVEEAMRRVTEEKMSCIAQLNPEFARDCSAAFVQKRPLIVCAQGIVRNGGGMDALLNNVCSGRAASCRSNTTNIYNWTGGFYDGNLPNNLYLTADDPTQMDGEPAWTEARQRNMESTMFHEMLHSCGHAGGAQHNHPHFNDEVYGCEAMCGGDSSRLTKEGCQACVTSRSEVRSRRVGVWPPATSTSEHKADRANDREFCNQFPKEAVLSNLALAQSIEPVLANCDSDSELSLYECYSAIKGLLYREDLRNACGTIPADSAAATDTWRRSCLTTLRTRMANKIVEAGRVAADGEELFKAMGVLAMGSRNRFTVNRLGNGDLEKSFDFRAPCIEMKVAGQLLYMASMGYCQELSHVTSDAAATTLRNRYESSIPIRMPARGATGSLPLFQNDPVSVTDSRARCESLGANELFAGAIDRINLIGGSRTGCSGVH